MPARENSDQTFDVGSRIRELRQSRGLSMRALGRISGLSPNALSMIERGLTSPTVSTVYKISHAMGLPVTSIFREKPGRTPCVHRRQGSSPQIKAPDAVIENLGGEEFEGLMEPYKITLEPGSSSGDLPITHSGSDFIYVQEGTISFEVKDEIFTMKKGDSLLIDSELPHFFQNPTDKQASILLVLSNFSIDELPGDHIQNPADSPEE